MKTVTVFTPTYNRGYCIEKLYRSLCRQTSKDFVWLVIDDGSTDNTRDKMNMYINEGILEIRYVYQLNAGKHVAHNNGVELCDTELFIDVDSDDYLIDNAIEIIISKNIHTKKDVVLGYCYRKTDENEKKVASEYPSNISKCGLCDLYHKYGFIGDTALVFKTKLIKGHHIPSYDGERFAPESILYNELNSIAPMVLCEEGIYICNYLDDGYTKNTNKLMVNNPCGYATYFHSESYYGNGFLYKGKLYGQYLGMCETNKIKKESLVLSKKPSLIYRLAGRVLLSHYSNFFSNLKKSIIGDSKT
ncbi:MAG: glycosyltransferase family 2 protein [Christensenellaceae bacterium]